MRHFGGKVFIILVEIEVARPTDSALHYVTENITNTTSYWCQNLMIVGIKFTEAHFYYLHKAYRLAHAWSLFVLGYILLI